MSVDDENGSMLLTQSDIDLPGVIPIQLIRKNQSNTVAIGIFGSGWSVNLISYLDTTTGDIRVTFPGDVQTFKADDGYTTANKKLKLTFTGPDEVTVESRGGEKWVFSTADRTLQKYIDANGNEITYTWKTVDKIINTNDPPYNTRRVFCPLTVTYPGNRVMTFSYDTTGDYQYLCRSVESPSGFTVSYSYTDELLTGISKSNGQVLSYSYDKVTDPVKTVGKLTKITYANAAEVELTYSGTTGQVESVSGPEGYDHVYTYDEIESELGPLPVGGTGGLPFRAPPTKVVELTDSLDHKTTYRRGPTDNTPGYQMAKRVTDALNYTEESILNGEGLPIEFKDRRGNTTEYTYDTGNSDPLAKRNLLTQTNPLGKTWNYTWDSNRNLTKVKDPLNHEVNMTYDTAGNLLTVTNGLSQTVLSGSYTARGEIQRIEDGRGNATTFEYNTPGFLTKLTDAASEEWIFSYDNAGNLLEMENPLGKKWETTYNGFYKPATYEDPLGKITTLTYDEMANLTKVEDANGNEVEWTYDKLQRITTVTDALNNTTSFDYDAETNLTKLTDALGREYTYTFDAVNQTKTFEFPGGSEESYNYDPNGNLTKLTNRADQEISYTYDAANRLTQKKYEVTSGTATTFERSYDDANRLTSVVRKKGATTESALSYTYDAANRLTEVSADGKTVEYDYDLSQNLSEITYPSSLVAKYEYDARNQVNVIKTGSNTVQATYTRDAAGRVTKRALANGLETVYTWDDANRVTKIELRETATPANIRQSFEYGYDDVGNRLWTKYQSGKGDVYRYDATYQVTGVKYGVDDPTVGYDSVTNPTRVVTYEYDAVGNRTSVTENGNSVTYTRNNLNQYTAVGGTNYTYSTRGDLTGDGTWTYGYDHEGRLISAVKSGTSVTYQYDGVGRRIGKDVNGTITRYIYDGYNLIEERDGSDTVTARYVYETGIDRPLLVVKGTNQYYYQQDVLGNVTALTDESGAVVEQYEYDIFGNPTIKDGSGTVKSSSMTPFLFTGREYDGETGLYHYRTRGYSVTLGRFLQPDSIEFDGGDVNLYRYVQNNSINHMDPMGLRTR